MARKPGGSCCDGSFAAVLLLCSVFLPLSVSVFLLFLQFLTVQVLLSMTGRTVGAGSGSGGGAAVLLLFLCKDISPYVFSFVFFFFLFSFSIRFRFFPLCNCSSPLFFPLLFLFLLFCPSFSDLKNKLPHLFSVLPLPFFLLPSLYL